MPDLLLYLFHQFGLAAMFGLIAVGAVFAWPFCSTTRAMLLIQTLGAGSFALHFLLIGAETAALTSCAVIFQLMTVRFIKSRLQVNICFMLSIAFLTALAILNWHGLTSILALVGCTVASLARLQKVPGLMKLAFLASTPFWIVHNLLVGSLFGSAVDVVSLTGNLSSLWRTAFGSAPWMARLVTALRQGKLGGAAAPVQGWERQTSAIGTL